MQLSTGFSGVEALLAQVHDIAPDKRMAFQGRLKALLKLGLLPHVQQGRGRAAKYGAGDIFVLALALQMAELGVPPERTVTILTSNIGALAEAVLASFKSADDADWSPTVIYFDTNGLSALKDSDEEVAVRFVSSDEFEKLFRFHITQETTRTAIITITGLVVRLSEQYQLLGHAQRFPGVSRFFEFALHTWAEKMVRRDGDDPEA